MKDSWRKEKKNKGGKISELGVIMQGTPRETALRVMKEIGVQAEIGGVKEIRRNGQFKSECELEVRMEKMEVLEKKKNLKGKRNNRGGFYMEAAKNAVVDKEGSREGKGDGDGGKSEIWEVDSE